MQYINKSKFAPLTFLYFAPLTLFLRNNKYKRLLKINNINDNNAYDFYNKNAYKYKISFNPYGVKKALLQSSKNRCVTCGKMIHIDNNHSSTTDDNDTKDNIDYSILSIEHFIPESASPFKILDWNNLYPMCLRCNNIRSNKKISSIKFVDSLDLKKELDSMLFLFDGRIESTEPILNDLIDCYDLNREFLVTNRASFINQVLNPGFKSLVKFEKTINPYHNKSIVFIDVYKKYHVKNNQDNKNCFIYKKYKEVMTNE